MRSTPRTRSSRFSVPDQASKASEGSPARSPAGQTFAQLCARARRPRPATPLPASRRSRARAGSRAARAPRSARVVVDAEIDRHVGDPAVAALRADDEERGRLLAAPVAARRLRCGEPRERAARRERLAAAGLERLGERVHGRLRDEDVPLRRVAGPRATARPVEAGGAGERTRLGRPRPRRRAGGPRGLRRPPSALDDLLRAAAPRAGARGPPARSAGSRSACVAIAPTPASAHETTEPTARNFDCTATPHSPRSRSQAQIEYVDGASHTSAGAGRARAARRGPAGTSTQATSGRASARTTASASAAAHDDRRAGACASTSASTSSTLSRTSASAERNRLVALEDDLGDAPPRWPRTTVRAECSSGYH